MKETITGDLQILDVSYIPACAHVMAQAFSDSPSYNFIFQETHEYRVEALEWLFVKNLNLTVGKCPSVLRGILNNDGKVVACFLWTPSKYAKLNMWEMIKAGLWQVPLRFGFGPLKRLINLINRIEEKDDGSSYPYIMLERMVVLPEFQGQGLGTEALKAALEADSTVEVRLNTQEERNVRFYQRLGFVSVHDQDYYEEDPEYKFHNWKLLRKANNDNSDTKN